MQRLKFDGVGLRWAALGTGTLLAVAALAQTTPHDPGVRPGTGSAGGPVPGLTSQQNDFFLQAKDRFQEVDSVSGTIESGVGLGPAFNNNSCAACHIQPAVGGGSPAVNPQVAGPKPVNHLDGAINDANTGDFLFSNGPIREVRFIKNPDGTLDGGVHDVFTIRGRTDAPGCDLLQPDFHTQIVNHNAIFRIPISLFGDGLVEAVSDSALRDNLADTASQRAALGIGGRFNVNGNDGTITRFGWKAQNKSLLLFSGEAYNVEQGVTNNLFQSDRFPAGTSDTTIANCTFNTAPEDGINILNGQANTIVGGVTKPNPNFNTTIGTASEMSADIVNFASFMQLLAAPTRGPSNASTQNGEALFNSIGCALCHTPSLTTVVKNGRGINGGADSTFPALANVTFHPFSDFALHHMGSFLADGVIQGVAGPDEFRTAPLMGLGQRIFFLHDGRTTDLLQAIAAHSDDTGDCTTLTNTANFAIDFSFGDVQFSATSTDHHCGSEANQVITKFNQLTLQQKQDILNFLRSL
jgi:CxxC motif-containing protein (DUF1111 family)